MVACLAATPRPSSVSSPSIRMFICGFSGEYREYQKHEKEAKEAKAKAVAVFKKSQEAKQQKIKKKFKRPARLVKPDHGLSESDSE